MRILFRLVITVGVLAAVFALARGCSAHASDPRPPPPEVPDLDALEARMVHAAEITRRWETLAERHAGATELACEQMAAVAMTWEVR